MFEDIMGVIEDHDGLIIGAISMVICTTAGFIAGRVCKIRKEFDYVVVRKSTKTE